MTKVLEHQIDAIEETAALMIAHAEAMDCRNVEDLLLILTVLYETVADSAAKDPDVEADWQPAFEGIARTFQLAKRAVKLMKDMGYKLDHLEEFTSADQELQAQLASYEIDKSLNANAAALLSAAERNTQNLTGRSTL